MSSWLLALLASSQVPYELLALVCTWDCSREMVSDVPLKLLKFLLLLKKLEFILCSFLSDDVRNLAYGKKVNF